jgi:hypothetical protein
LFRSPKRLAICPFRFVATCASPLLHGLVKTKDLSIDEFLELARKCLSAGGIQVRLNLLWKEGCGRGWRSFYASGASPIVAEPSLL